MEMTDTHQRHIKYSLLFKLIVLFVFFLPLKFFELPSVAFGFGINISRICIVLTTIILLMNVALDVKYLSKFRIGKYSNPYIPFLLVYFLFSISYYYINVSLGTTILFGSEDFFTRNWMGRPIVQFISFFTYGIIPFYLIKRYAMDRMARKVIERTIVFCTLLLVYYGFLQQAFFYLGLPIAGMNAYIGRTAGLAVGDLSFMRFYSLGGEPREFGGFIIGALFFYVYYRYGKATRFFKFNVGLMIAAFLLTFSTSAFLIAAVSLIVIVLDTLFYRKGRIKFRYLVLSVLIFVLLMQTPFFSIVGDRTVRYYEIISSRLEGETGQGYLLSAQSLNFVIVPYLKQTVQESPLHLLIGHGYGNFLTPTAGILKEHFDYDIVKDAHFSDTSSFLVKILVEGGIIGALIYLRIFIHTLWLNNKLLFFYKKNNNRHGYYKTLMLRFAFIVFFISSAIQISFYYFIVMALIIARLNSVVKAESRKV